MVKPLQHFEELMTALQAGERELRLPPNALNYLGAGYVSAMVRAAQAEYGDDFILWCDAGEHAGTAMEALSCGLKHISLRASDEVLAKLQQMARQVGAVVQREGGARAAEAAPGPHS